jgi:hypothetical protein
MDLIKIEIEQLKQQVEILDAIFDECNKVRDSRVSFCDKLKISIKEYYESILHKLGYCNRKEE